MPVILTLSEQSESKGKDSLYLFLLLLVLSRHSTEVGPLGCLYSSIYVENF